MANEKKIKEKKPDQMTEQKYTTDTEVSWTYTITHKHTETLEHT